MTDDPIRPHLERLAREGDAAAMCELGSLLADTEPAEARQWWERAVALGDVDACFVLVRRLLVS